MTDLAESFHDKLTQIIDTHVTNARGELSARWNAWSLDITQPQRYEVVGGLLARQVTLATQLARSPQSWNGHVAPLFLRSMTDAHISLGWILEEPENRCDKYVKFGLGQKKLFLEHWKAYLAETGEKDIDNHPMVKAMEAWLNAQRFHFVRVPARGGNS